MKYPQKVLDNAKATIQYEPYKNMLICFIICFP